MPGVLIHPLQHRVATLIAVAVAFVVWAAVAWAETPVLSAPEAAARLASGDLIVLDIRAPQEWKETGVAQGAWPVSMHAPDFPQRLQAILAQHPPADIALICATGGRSAYITQVLAQNGITGVSDISEGMFGNGQAPGWIARGLPVVASENALARYTSEMEGRE